MELLEVCWRADEGRSLATTAINVLYHTGVRNALCAICIGVEQGIALVVERV